MNSPLRVPALEWAQMDCPITFADFDIEPAPLPYEAVRCPHCGGWHLAEPGVVNVYRRIGGTVPAVITWAWSHRRGILDAFYGPWLTDGRFLQAERCAAAHDDLNETLT